MANQRVTDLTELTATASNDYVHVVDVSDTTQSAAGLSKKVQISNLPGYRPINRPTNGGFATSTFASYFPFAVWRDGGGHIQTNFDHRKWAPNVAVPSYGVTGSGVNTYYVSTAGNDSNTGASWAQAFASINKAITTGNAAAAPYLVYIAGGLYQRGNSYQGTSGGTYPSQACAFVAVGGRVINSMSALNSATTWTLNSGTTYQTTRSIVQRVVALDLIDEWGDYTEFTKAASLSACQATPGSWYTDNTTTYVNRLDGAAVTTANTRMFLNGQLGSQSTSSGNMYAENIDFEGGENYVMDVKGNATGRMVFNNCSFKWSSSITPSADINCGIFDVDGAAFINCVSARGQNDGFAAHQLNSKNPFVIWIGCIGHHQGTNISGVTSSNAVTTHDGIKSISINGTYWNCNGGQSAHVIANTQHWSIGDACHSSQGDIALGGTAPPSDWLCDQSNASIWVDSGRSAPGNTSPTGYYSLYTDVTSGSDTANIYYRNCVLAGAIGPNCSAY